MKTFNRRVMVIVLLIIVTAKPSRGQLFQDLSSRSYISVQHKFDQKLSFTGIFQIYLIKKSTVYDKSVFAGEVAYEFSRWLKTGFSYRLCLLRGDNYNEYRFLLSFNVVNSKKWKLKIRPLWQQRLSSIEARNVGGRPIHLLRIRSTVNYVLTKKNELYLFTENYQKIRKLNWSFERQSSGIGTEFIVGKKTVINTEFVVFTNQIGKLSGRMSTGIMYPLGNKY